MKYLFLIFVVALSFPAFSQDQQSQDTPKQVESKPRDTEMQAQEEEAAVIPESMNDFEIGPYDREGKYEFYNRSKLEAKQNAGREQAQ